MEIEGILQGNKVFTEKTDKKLLQELAEKGQQPVATVVACSDSRVPVEVIFNHLRPGAHFVIRVAGNVVADASVKGSIEYAVEHLKTPYLIVLGHTDCGAVKASLQGIKDGQLGKLLAHMHLQSTNMDDAVIENINLQLKRVAAMDSVKHALAKQELQIYGMLYNLKTGLVLRLNSSAR